LIYKVRPSSEIFINSLKTCDDESIQTDDSDCQDIFYFKKAIEQINNKIKDLNEQKTQFVDYILDKVQIIYIQIEEAKAVKTFTMMNGNKATMLPEELIKAEMLRKISENKEVSTSENENLEELKEIIAKDWETNAIRSKYAREWDKWLYWWNRKDVQAFFDSKNPMGLLLKYCYFRQNLKEYTRKHLDEIQKSYSFDSFKSLLSDKQQTKLMFKQLRDLQKSFEDIFDTPKIFNYLGLALKGNIDKFEVINFFIDNKNKLEDIAKYAKWSLVGATHLEITDPSKSAGEERKENRADNVLHQLSDKFVYQNAYDLAAKQLLRLNVEEDNKLFENNGRKFDFSIYEKGKSLEHIHPKSKAYHKVETPSEDGTKIITYKNGNDVEIGSIIPTGNEWLDRDTLTGCTEHSIGNLLLLDKIDNSQNNDDSFEDKKRKYIFNTNKYYKSRNLLHTVSVFSNSKWGKEEIEKNQQDFISRFKQDYGIQ
jgi:hypothetical protein